MATPEQQIMFKTTALVFQYTIEVAQISRTFAQHSGKAKSSIDADRAANRFFCPVFANLVAMNDPSVMEDLDAVIARVCAPKPPEPVRLPAEGPCDCTVCASINATDPGYKPNTPFQELLFASIESAITRAIDFDGPVESSYAQMILETELGAIVDLVRCHLTARV